MATSAQITGWITEAESQRHKVAMGQAFIELWRDGRRMQLQVTDVNGLNDYLKQLQSELVEAQLAEGTKPTRRRRAIGLAWMN